MSKAIQSNPEIFKSINQEVSKNFYEKQRATGLDDICASTSLSRAKVAEFVQIMLKGKQIHEIFSGKGQPTLYIPFSAIKDMMRLEPKPKWISEFIFIEKQKIIQSVEDSRKEIEKFESFERILYAHDKLLESAVTIVLKFLEFETVVHTDDPQKHDIEFRYKENVYVVEVKGKTGQADKDDVLQLRGWIDIKLEEGLTADSLTGILVVNSYRHIEPGKRNKEPFTEKAKQFLKMNKFIYLSTSQMYEIVKQVIGEKIGIAEARDLFIKGEKV